MALVLLLLVLGGGVLEVWTTLRVADLIGVGPTVLLLLVSSIAGARVLSRGTLRAWRRVADASRTGEPVGRRVLDAGLLVVTGVLLLVPGLLSGALGLLLLLPPVRAIVRPALRLLVLRRVALPVVLGTRGAGWAAGRVRTRADGTPVPGDVEGTASVHRDPPAAGGPAELDDPGR